MGMTELDAGIAKGAAPKAMASTGTRGHPLASRQGENQAAWDQAGRGQGRGTG